LAWHTRSNCIAVPWQAAAEGDDNPEGPGDVAILKDDDASIQLETSL
jgi:hypothetical protein